MYRLAAATHSNRWIPHKPTPKQAEYLYLPCREALYGGAAGGGKSDALLMAALQFVDIPGYNALLLRRTFPDLNQPGALIPRSKEWLKGTAARYNEQIHRWTFPSGATLSFGYLNNANDIYQYQSSEFEFIGFDELTQFYEAWYTYMFSRLRRLEGVDIPLRMRAASNPGGLGHQWVYRRFVVQDGTADRQFISAMLKDNPYLDQQEYTRSLQELDETTKAQLLEGRWVTDSRMHPFLAEWWQNKNRFRLGDVAFKNRAIERAWSWDMGVKGGVDNSFTVGVCGELTPDYRLAIRKVWRKQVGFHGLPDIIQEQARSVQDGNKLRWVVIEDKANGTPAIQTLQEIASDDFLRVLHPFQPVGSKPERWASAGVWCSRGCVLFPHPSMEAPWLRDFEAEIYSVQDEKSKPNDQADALSQLIDFYRPTLAAGWHARNGELFT